MAMFYSTFIPGFESLITKLLKKEGVKIVQVLSGAVLYKGEAEKKVRQYKFFNNTFLVLASNSSSREHLVAKVAQKLNQSTLNLPKNAHTFRVITSEENKTINLEKKLYQKLIVAIKENTNLKLVSGKADTEFWLLTRREGLSIFARRLTKRHWNLKSREKGALPTELAYLLCLISDPQKDDVFLDPFAGSGAISLARNFLKGSREIWAADSDHELVKTMKERFKRNATPKIRVLQSDASNLRDFKSESVTKVVTDPPWGHYQDVINTKDLYRKFLQEAERVLTNNGLLIMLVSRETDLKPLLTRNLVILENFNILLAGNKASVYKISKIYHTTPDLTNKV